jgi:orotate phosphoribosyltransferase
VLAIEDVVTTGGALIAAVEVLRAAGLEVERALCVLDREEGGGEALESLGVRLESLFRRADLGMPAA